MDNRELVERLWDDARKRDAVEASALPSLAPHEEILHSEALRILNARWDVTLPATPPSVGAMQPLKRRVKAAVAAIVRSMLDDYVSHEREFRAELVRTINALAVATDRLASEIRTVAEGGRVESERLVERMNLLHELIEERIAELTATRER